MYADVCMEDGSSMDGVDMGDARSPSKTEYCDEEDSQGAEGEHCRFVVTCFLHCL